MPLCIDPAVFFRTMNECGIFAVAYDADLLMICKNKDTATIVKKELRKSFILQELRRASEFVGVAFDYDGKKIIMTLS